MKTSPHAKRASQSLTIISVVTLLLVSFQNCMEPPQNTMVMSSEGEKTKAPFAYKVKADRLGYMSCNKMGSVFDKKTFFTFRFGAMENKSGVSFSDEYKSYIKSNGLTSSRIREDLSSTKYNRDATLFMSIRKSNEVADKMVVGPSHVSTNVNYEYIWDDISVGEVTTGMINNYYKKQDPVRETADGKLVGSLSYNGGADDLLPALTNASADAGFLSIGFRSAITNSGDENIVGLKDVSSDSEPYAYGFGLALGSGRARKGPGVNSHQDNPFRVITQAREKDLSNGDNFTHDWTCPVDFQFKIVPRSQWSQAGCANPYDTNALLPNSTAATNALKYAREILNDLPGGNFWTIDPNNLCIFAQSDNGYCYEGNANPNIQWNQLGPCGPGKPEGLCIHYFSLCYQN